MNNKASALALTQVDKCLRGVGREMQLMGRAPVVVSGHPEPAGMLYGTSLGVLVRLLCLRYFCKGITLILLACCSVPH